MAWEAKIFLIANKGKKFKRKIMQALGEDTLS